MDQVRRGSTDQESVFQVTQPLKALAARLLCKNCNLCFALVMRAIARQVFCANEPSESGTVDWCLKNTNISHNSDLP